MEIVTIAGPEDAGHLSLFSQVAADVYTGDPVWAPASEMMWQQKFRQLHSHLDAFVRLFVLVENGRPSARCLLQYIPGVKSRDGRPQGWISFFECLEDSTGAAQALLAHCEKVIKGRGVQSVLIGKSDNQLAGVLTGGFHLPHLAFTNHNPPYYESMFMECGYRPEQEMVALYFTREHTRPFRLKLRGLQTRVFNRSALEQEIQRIHHLQNDIFSARPDYIPRTLEEDRQLVEGFLPYLEDEFIIFAETGAGEPVGLLVCVPDTYQKMQGEAVNRARIITIGAVPAYQRKGVGALMGAHLMGNLLRNERYVYLEGSWVKKNNLEPLILAKRFNAQPGRKFALFEKRIR